MNQKIKSSSKSIYSNNDYEVFRAGSTMTFILTPTKTIVHIGINGAFLIDYHHNNYKKQLDTLRDLVRRNEMTSVSDLESFCNLRPGRISKMYGLELVPTKLERYINV